jgi:hypothetical protein
VYFNVNCNVFFKLIKVHLLVSELYIYQNARCNDKKKIAVLITVFVNFAKLMTTFCTKHSYINDQLYYISVPK